ncbi:MAG: C40 family peptidase [Chitinophagales bacterium]|nr:C40 family peptidase [Chitinophagales bacterium]
MKSLLVVLLVLLFRFHTQAQPTADSLNVAVDSLAVDSFFRIRGIDLTLADNAQIYYEVYSHYGTCYRYGSSGSGSFDCSGFVRAIYKKVYNKEVPHSSAGMYPLCKPIAKGDIPAEGDLVFFKIHKKRISHVGIYLQHNKFAHASTQSGIVISDLDEPYYKRTFYKAGRIE